MLPKSAVLATAGLLLLLGCDEAPEQKTLTQDDAADTDTDSDATSAIPDDAEVSSEGGECPNNYTACDDRCVDLASHPEHCGACGDYCGRGESCIAAQCIDCEEDPSACDDAESGPTSSVSEPEVTAGNPEPSEEPEPQVAAEPEVATEAEPEAGAEPESAVPEPSAEPEPGMTPEPVSVPEPSIEPEPATEPEPIATEPEPLSTPEPEPAAEPEVTVETVEPEPAVEPEPIAEPEPAMDCQTLASNTNSGPLGTAEVCFEIPAPIAGWESSNIGSRTVTVNGEQVLAPALPAPVNGMYTFVFSAGEPSYTSFSYWTL